MRSAWVFTIRHMLDPIICCSGVGPFYYKKGGFIIKIQKMHFLWKGSDLTKKKALPGMPRSGAHRLDIAQQFSNHFPFILIGFIYKSIYLIDFPYISLFPYNFSLNFAYFGSSQKHSCSKHAQCRPNWWGFLFEVHDLLRAPTISYQGTDSIAKTTHPIPLKGKIMNINRILIGFWIFRIFAKNGPNE